MAETLVIIFTWTKTDYRQQYIFNTRKSQSITQCLLRDGKKKSSSIHFIMLI